jgi:PTS system N-acetylglucosamine-specific IIC component
VSAGAPGLAPAADAEGSTAGGAKSDAASFDPGLAGKLFEALGGKRNVVSVGTASTRLRVTVRNASSINEGALRSLGVRGVARPAADIFHILIGPNAQAAGRALQALA